MSSLIVLAASSAALLVAYFLYSRFLDRVLFRLSPDNATPSVTREDGVDFVPTRPLVLFGHHFASIAGLGPILGPAVAVIWGWLPALLWVVFGGILIGAVHDLGTMVVSVRHQGRTIGDVCRDLMGPRARLLFLLISFFAIALAMGVFAFVVAKLFVRVNPQAIIPVVSLIVMAVLVGAAVYKWKASLTLLTLLALVLMGFSVWAGIRYPVKTYQWFLSAQTRQAIADEMAPSADQRLNDDALGLSVAAHFDGRAEALRDAGQHLAAEKALGQAKEIRAAVATAEQSWIYALLAYAFVASVLPVWLLLQPRDYLNSYQLYLGVAMLVVFLFIARSPIQAPALAAGPADAPPLLPFLFILVACGAVSGFHSLVSSGTSARQLRREPDARPIAYGGMLVESLLAVLVILACTVGGAAVADKWNTGGAYRGAYQTIMDRALGTFADGVGGLSAAVNPAWPPVIKTIILVVVVGFAITTLDTGTRLLRFNVEELSRALRVPGLGNRYAAALIAVAAVGYFALFKIGGTSVGMTLWSLFGATNQLLAGLGLLVVSVYLFLSRRPVWFTLIPMAVMLAITLWGMAIQMGSFWSQYAAAAAKNDPVWPAASLMVVGGLIILIAVWLFVEGVIVFLRKRRDTLPADSARS